MSLLGGLPVFDSLQIILRLVLINSSVMSGNELFFDEYEYINIFKKNDKYYFFTIKCQKHGTFEKKIQNHILKKQGCPLCSKPSKLTKEIFAERAKKIHENKYNYDNVKYIDNRTKVKIECELHGFFEMTPSNHLKGQKCQNCCKNKPVDNKNFIDRAKEKHGDKYIYDKINYDNMHTNVEIICKKHGLFTQTPINHLAGNECYKCRNIVKTSEDFIYKANEVHDNKYNYDETKYISTRKNVIITCILHGNFVQKPNDHLNGNGCQKCAKTGFSKLCLAWLENICKNEKIFIQHAGNLGEKSDIFDGKRYKFDGYCEKNNTVYEFHGNIWHGNPEMYNPTDKNPFNKKTFGELYTKTIERENIIKTKYNLITICEKDFLNNK